MNFILSPDTMMQQGVKLLLPPIPRWDAAPLTTLDAVLKDPMSLVICRQNEADRRFSLELHNPTENSSETSAVQALASLFPHLQKNQPPFDTVDFSANKRPNFRKKLAEVLERLNVPPTRVFAAKNMDINKRIYPIPETFYTRVFDALRVGDRIQRIEASGLKLAAGIPRTLTLKFQLR